MLTRRTELKRTAFARKPAGDKPNEPKTVGKPKPPKTVKCGVKGCGIRFVPDAPFVKWCGPDHGEVIARERIAKAKAKQQRQERARDRNKVESMKTLPQLLKEAQSAFNAVVRLRDMLAGHPCISSGRPLDWSGNAVDAGHYRSVGSAPHLRFNEDNVHAQSKHDNQWKSGNAVDYRIGLIARIGLARVEALESNNEIHKWTHDEVRSIRDQYRAKLREMKKENAA